MAKLRQTRNSSKLTLAGYKSLARKLEHEYPKLAEVFTDPEKVRLLNNLLNGSNLLCIEKELTAKLQHLTSQLTNLTQLRTIVDANSAGEVLKAANTMRLAEDYPTPNDHLIHLMGEGMGYAKLVRQLAIHQNWMGLDREEISDTLYQIEQLCTALAGVAGLDDAKGHRPMRA